MLRLRAVAFVPCEEYIKDKILAHVLAFLSSYSFLFCFLSQRCDLPFENFILYLHFGVDVRIVLRTLPNIYDRVFAQIFKGLMPLTHSVHPPPPPPPILSAWTVCRFKGGLGKKRGVVFLRGVDTPMHTM